MGEFWPVYLTLVVGWVILAGTVMGLCWLEARRRQRQLEMALLRRKMEERAKARVTEN
jgi:hypothetical protein